MFIVGAATDIGRKRSQNQDSIAAVPQAGLFVVADGMGGHRGGETASSMVTQLVPEMVRSSINQSAGWDPRQVISSAISYASHEIFLRSQREPQLQGMGTTTVACLFKDRRLTIGHVGDSRVYYFRDGDLWQLTRDHSLVQEKLRAGMITREEVKTDRMKNVITRSVGFEPEVNVELYEFEARPGDQFLLCSDGLSSLVEDQEIGEIMELNRQRSNDLQETVKQLIAAANANGGDDNISTVLIELAGEN